MPRCHGLKRLLVVSEELLVEEPRPSLQSKWLRTQKRSENGEPRRTAPGGREGEQAQGAHTPPRHAPHHEHHMHTRTHTHKLKAKKSPDPTPPEGPQRNARRHKKGRSRTSPKADKGTETDPPSKGTGEGEGPPRGHRKPEGTRLKGTGKGRVRFGSENPEGTHKPRRHTSKPEGAEARRQTRDKGTSGPKETHRPRAQRRIRGRKERCGIETRKGTPPTTPVGDPKPASTRLEPLWRTQTRRADPNGRTDDPGSKVKPKP